MSWAVGTNDAGRDIGYGVPAICDHPGCIEDINRGLAYLCGGTALGAQGCGLYFCSMHRGAGDLCVRCAEDEEPFEPTPDAPRWLRHKLEDPTWAEWREANPDKVKEMS